MEKGRKDRWFTLTSLSERRKTGMAKVLSEHIPRVGKGCADRVYVLEHQNWG